MISVQQQKIREVLESNRPFEWGVWDCCQFARAVVYAKTGRDVGSEFEYKTEAEATTIIDNHLGLRRLISKVLGIDGTHDLDRLTDGDPVLVVAPLCGPLLGVWVNGKAIVWAKERPLHTDARYVLEGWPVEGL